MASANVEPIIDTSNSMTASGYVTVTKTDSEAFIRSARPGDRIGVASYDQYGRITYPPGGSSLVEVDFSLKQTKDAAAAIEHLSFTGPATNIGDGILKARMLMDPAPSPKGLVLLSDGYQNFGTNPLTVLPNYPIYSCAMGPYSDQNLMEQIGIRTGGAYYYAPSVFDMTLIFNQIRGEQPQTAVVTNDQKQVQAATDFPIPISGGKNGVQFMVVWNGSPDPPTLALTQPDGTLWPQPPDVKDVGYAIWNLYEPAMHGTWRVTVTAPPLSGALTVTTSGYEFGDEGDIKLQLSHTPEGEGTFHLAAQLLHDGIPLAEQSITAEVIRPVHGLREAIDRVRNEFAQLEIKHGDVPADTPPDNFALRKLEHLKGLQLVPSTRHHLDFVGGKANVRGVEDASITLRVVASGKLPTGKLVQRTAMRTITMFRNA
jgi:hypothetical protein